MTTSASDIQALYVAYFNRPADVLGLQFWIDKANAAGSTVAVANAFSNSKEYTDLYAGKSSADIVNSIYHNLFGRDAEPAGLIYWANKLNTGALDIGHVAYTILSSAQNADLVAVQSKVSAASTFTSSLTTTAQITGYDGDAANAVAKAWLAGVTDADTLTAHIAAPALTAVSTDVIAAKAGTVNVGVTTGLTSNVDNLTGGAGNDTFVASTVLLIDPATGKPTIVTDTLQSQDVITGGTGNDTLKVTISEANALTITPTLSGVENVVATFKAGATNILDLSGSTGVTKVTVDGSTAASNVLAVGDAALAVVNVKGLAVNFSGATGDALSISATNTGVTGTLVTIDAAATGAASAATSEAITVSNSFIKLMDTTANTGILTATIAATGSNKVAFTDAAVTLTNLSVTGSGSVNSTVALTALKTLTVSDGGITFTNAGSTATAFNATTGAGKDTLTIEGANAATISTGAGNDKVTTANTALAAAAKIDLGAGDDTLTFAATHGPAAGATLTGGDGTDTIAFASGDYAGVAAFTAANLAKIAGFEVLGFTNAVTTASYDVSKIAGVGSFTAFSGVATGATATLTGLSAASTITLAGDLVTNNGHVAAVFATDTSADVLNLVAKSDFADTNDAVADVFTVTTVIDASKMETLNFNSTGNQTATLTGADGNLTDTVLNVVTVTDTALVNMNITGDQAASFTSANAMTKLAVIDGTANTAGVTIDAHLDVTSTNAALTIKGSLTAASTLTGSANVDTIIGGAAADVITGGVGGDTLTGGGGNNTFVMAAGDSTIATGNADTITDFHANTYGNGTAHAADVTGANGVAAAKLTGDVIALTHTGATATAGIQVQVVTNSGDAQTFLQTAFGSDAGTHVHAALNSTTGDLYVDLDGNGTADMFIHLTGVTTITTTAFTVA